MDQTIRVLRNALAAAPNEWETRRHLAELLAAAGQQEDAARLIRDAPHIPGETAETIFAAEHLVSIDPHRAGALVDEVLRSQQDHEGALRLRERLNAPSGSSVPEEAPRSRPVPPPVKRSSRPVPPPPRPRGAAPSTPVKPAPQPPPAPRRQQASFQAPPPSPAAEACAPDPAASAAASVSPTAAASGSSEVPAPAQTAFPAPSLAAAKASIRANKKALAEPSKPLSPIESAIESERHRGQAMAWLGAGILHALLLFLFLFWVLAVPRLPQQAMVVRAEIPPPPDATPQMKSLQQRLPQKPSSSSAARSKVITSDSVSPVVAPEVEELTITDEPLGAGDSFGYGSGWGDGDGGGGGGVVQFFGEKEKAKRVAYIVDFSYSMISNVAGGKKRIDTLKDELIDSIGKLPPTMQFNIIYFSGAGWTAGEDPEGKEFQERLQATMQGENPKLNVPWLTAEAKVKKEQTAIIEAMPLAGQETGGGTMWTPPLRLALQMRQPPDLIYLLTDGAAHDSHTFVANLLKLNPTKIPIHTIAMEIPGDTAKRLAEVAEKTGGKFTIILDGQLYTGERAKSYTDPKFNPIQ
ncbi:MAG TPA: hypothetical protein VMN36_09980 [Verrucomicrobiales bacterium]|nr:hypothetical protein [Verrucomicrobiales bacterium]